MLSILFSWLKENYIDLLFKVIPSIFSIVLIVLRSHASKKLKNSEQLSAFLQWIPTAVKFANDLFPTHGDGAKRLNYVVEKCSSLFPLISLNTIVESVDQILSADKKGGDVYEKSTCSQEERQEDFCKNCKVDVCFESTQKAVPRRYSVLKK